MFRFDHNPSRASSNQAVSRNIQMEVFSNMAHRIMRLMASSNRSLSPARINSARLNRQASRSSGDANRSASLYQNSASSSCYIPKRSIISNVHYKAASGLVNNLHYKARRETIVTVNLVIRLQRHSEICHGGHVARCPRHRFPEHRLGLIQTPQLRSCCDAFERLEGHDQSTFNIRQQSTYEYTLLQWTP